MQRQIHPAVIASVAEDSPAWDAGFEPGCQIVAVNGKRMRDVIDWQWYADDYTVDLDYIDNDGESGSIELERDDGEDWGISFTEAVFDRIHLCRNACTFCFMRQLPDDARDSLTLRDDDYRLSFLQGTFVTFTNIEPEDEQRIIEQQLSPLRFSLHAITPEVRRRIIGKRAQHGIEVAERLLAAGIQLHAQIVLMPGENDGEELRRTLQWAWEHPGVMSVGIVPVGFTKHQTRFHRSFDTPESAQGVIECIEPFQKRAMREGRPDAWVFASDEFYRNAYPHDLLDHLPPTEFYGSFDLFEDGIGIVRDSVDDWNAAADSQARCAQALSAAGKRVLFVAGCAQREFFGALIDRSPLRGLLEPLYVKNEYFGGNVDVTGLLCGCDIGPAVNRAIAAKRQRGEADPLVVMQKVILNADGVTLDDMTVDELSAKAGVQIHVVSCEASKFLEEIARIVQAEQAAASPVL